VRKIILACLILTIASVSPADARNHKGAPSSKPAHHHTAQAGDKSSAGDKASADTDAAMDKKIKSICRGC
jgi:hypothetical protein